MTGVHADGSLRSGSSRAAGRFSMVKCGSFMDNYGWNQGLNDTLRIAKDCSSSGDIYPHFYSSKRILRWNIKPTIDIFFKFKTRVEMFKAFWKTKLFVVFEEGIFIRVLKEIFVFKKGYFKKHLILMFEATWLLFGNLNDLLIVLYILYYCVC